MYVKDSVRSLRIEYPTGSGIDDVSFIEGDNFGMDVTAGMRDGVSLSLQRKSSLLFVNFVIVLPKKVKKIF